MKSPLPELPGNKPVFWIHASSLGEFEQGIPLIKELKRRRPDHHILITFFSPSGYEQCKDFEDADLVLYLPRDILSEMRSFIEFYKPAMLVLIKYDIWPLMIKEVAKVGIPIYLISSVFRHKQLYFKWYGKWYLSILQHFSHIFVQDEASLKLLAKKGIENVSRAGDSRIDRVLELKNNSSEIEGLDIFVQDSRVIIAGSSWQTEEKYLEKFLRETQVPGLKIILAPHDVSPNHLNAIERLFGESLVSYSQLLQKPETGSQKTILLIDRTGLLSRLYRYGDIAVVGGAFGAGLHNILEPAVFGLPIVFGPTYHKFIEASELIKSKAAFSVKSYGEFQGILSQLLTDQNTLSNASKGCSSYVNNHNGATELITSHLLEKA